LSRGSAGELSRPLFSITTVDGVRVGRKVEGQMSKSLFDLRPSTFDLRPSTFDSLTGE
jgi:hypothetical protein